MKQTSIKKKTLIIILLTLGFTAAILTVFFTMAREVELRNHAFGQYYSDIQVTFKPEGIAELASITVENGIILTRVKPAENGVPGETLITISCSYPEQEVQDTYSTGITVTKHGLIYSANHSFSGIHIAFLLLGLFFITVSVFLFRWHREAKKVRYFSYQSVQDLGLFVFFLFLGLIHAGMVFFSLLREDPLTGDNFFTISSLALTLICLLSFPVLFIFSLLLSVSNIGLIRKEGASLTNALGILLSAFLMGGILVLLIMFFNIPTYLSIDLTDSALATLRALLASLFFYFVCNLFSTLLHCQLAGRHTPAYDKDYILILGCGIRGDGTLFPLLKGRADRAITFYRQQLEKTGKKAVFVPSGGQGPDECMPEGEAIRNYLVSQGIPESDILPETKSVNTLQNMQFSREVIEKARGEAEGPANISFSTTNFHVFRSGILAANCGMNADGMGAKTKWYFWPNALIREFIGMLVRHWKLNLIVVAWLVLISIFSGNIQWLFQLL